MKALKFIFLLLLPAALLIAGCVPSSPSSGKIGIAVSILPQAEFVEKIGGDKVDVVVMVPPGANLHAYEVTPNQILKLARAKMYAMVGSNIEFELSSMDKIKSVNRDMAIIDCSQGIELIKSDDPDEPGTDPHIWLSVKNAQVMVRTICQGIVKIDPANTAYYEQNRDAYLQQLSKLDTNINNGLANVKNRSFIIFHPSFGYFARNYNLTQIAIEQQGKEPGPAYITRLITEAKSKNIKVVFISPQFDKRTAEVIAREIGGRVAIIDDLARNYIDNMQLVESAMLQAMK